jgi:hypothetical protein
MYKCLTYSTISYFIKKGGKLSFYFIISWSLSKIIIYEYFAKEVHVCWVQGQIILKKKNDSGVIPIEMSYTTDKGLLKVIHQCILR